MLEKSRNSTCTLMRTMCVASAKRCPVCLLSPSPIAASHTCVLSFLSVSEDVTEGGGVQPADLTLCM